MTRRPGSRLDAATALMILASATWLVVGVNTIYLGDDLAYRHFGTTASGLRDLLIGFPSGHWLTTNGRAANYLAGILLSRLPQGLMALLNALMVGLFYWLTVKAAVGDGNGRRRFARVAVVGTIALGFCWWDSFCLFDVMLNYVWSSVLTLAVLFAIISRREMPTWLVVALLPVAALAGMMHEALGLSVAAGLVVALFYGLLSRGRRATALVAAYSAGALFCAASPGIWNRLGSDALGDAPWWLLIVESCWLTLGLLAGLGVAMLTRRRAEVLSFIGRDPWTLVSLTASIAGLVFVAVGGVVGRSGWFCQTFALIAASRIVLSQGVRLPKVVAGLGGGVVALCVTAHFAAVVASQLVAGPEMREFERLYTESPDGIVYLDHHSHGTLSRWALHRNSTVPDPDDAWLLQSLSRYARRDSVLPVVLPRAVLEGQTAFADGSFLAVDSLPAVKEIEGLPNRYIAESGGRQMVVTPLTLSGRRMFYATPREIDPGDR